MVYDGRCRQRRRRRRRIVDNVAVIVIIAAIIASIRVHKRSHARAFNYEIIQTIA